MELGEGSLVTESWRMAKRLSSEARRVMGVSLREEEKEPNRRNERKTEKEQLSEHKLEVEQDGFKST